VEHSADSVQIARIEERLAMFQAETRAAHDAIIERLDVKINGRLDRHAKTLTEHGLAIAGIQADHRQQTTTTTTTTSDGSSGVTLHLRPDAKTITALLLATAGLILALLTVWTGAK
jgi:hypothetical protein